MPTCIYCGKECGSFKYGRWHISTNTCDITCYHLLTTRSRGKIWKRVVYTNVDRLTEVDRKRFVDEPLELLNIAFGRSVSVDSFIAALQHVIRTKHYYHGDEYTFISYIVATSLDCKQYVPVEELKNCYDGLRSAGKVYLRFTEMLNIARGPGMGTCPLENRQNALFKREVSAMDATPEQKQAMLRRYAELGLDKVILLNHPARCARGIVAILAKGAGVVNRRALDQSAKKAVKERLDAMGLIPK